MTPQLKKPPGSETKTRPVSAYNIAVRFSMSWMTEHLHQPELCGLEWNLSLALSWFTFGTDHVPFWMNWWSLSFPSSVIIMSENSTGNNQINKPRKSTIRNQKIDFLIQYNFEFVQKYLVSFHRCLHFPWQDEEICHLKMRPRTKSKWKLVGVPFIWKYIMLSRLACKL